MYTNITTVKYGIGGLVAKTLEILLPKLIINIDVESFPNLLELIYCIMINKLFMNYYYL